jgi:hypothetical protein
MLVPVYMVKGQTERVSYYATTRQVAEFMEVAIAQKYYARFLYLYTLAARFG